MLVILYGLYRWAARRVAYRNDYCLSCADVRLAIQVRTFDVGHVFCVPLLPLGYRQRWFCSDCGSNPHQRVETSQRFKRFAAFIFAVGAIFFWLIPIERPEDVPIAWGLRLVVTAMFLGALAWCRTAPPTSLKELLTTVPPLPRDACALCGGALDERAFCGACKASRLEVDVPFQPGRQLTSSSRPAKQVSAAHEREKGYLLGSGLFVIGVGMTIHSWHTALQHGYYYPSLSAFGPTLACLGLAALLEPVQFYRRMAHTARTGRREPWGTLPRSQRILTIIGIAAGLVNYILLRA